MKNEILQFYEEHKITTEHIDEKNIAEYVRKRRNLYRQLGIPLLAIRDADILEIGPGVGHNTVPLILDWHCRHIDLVEPNLVAVNGLKDALSKMQVANECYRIFEMALEEFSEDKSYDMVIAEGYIHAVYNWKDTLKLIKKYTHQNSLVIVTCMDEFGIYVENMKRLVGQYMVRSISGGLEEKVQFLSEAWKDSVESLPGMTRNISEWILDTVFNKAELCKNPMTMKCAVEEMQEDFDVLGASQNIFVDYSWYKDLEYDYIESYKNQYDEKKHTFLTAYDMTESIHSAEQNKRLGDAIKETFELIRQIEAEKNVDISDIYKSIDKVTANTDNRKIQIFDEEIKEILMGAKFGKDIDFSKYSAWNSTFGKSLQYISFQRR